MTATRQVPPKFVSRALTASFLTVALVLGAVFIVISLEVRGRVRKSVADNLASAQQLFTRVEARRQQEVQATVATLAENPTLKAALDTWLSERGTAVLTTEDELLATVQRETDKLASRISADVLAIIDRARRRQPRRSRIDLAGTDADAADRSPVEIDDRDGRRARQRSVAVRAEPRASWIQLTSAFNVLMAARAAAEAEAEAAYLGAVRAMSFWRRWSGLGSSDRPRGFRRSAFSVQQELLPRADSRQLRADQNARLPAIHTCSMLRVLRMFSSGFAPRISKSAAAPGTSVPSWPVF